jgi:hypothetical protein
MQRAPKAPWTSFVAPGAGIVEDAAIMSAVSLALALVAAQLPAPSSADELPRFLVIPLEERPREQLDALYGALEAAGARTVDRQGRMGVDLPVDDVAFESARPEDVRAALLKAKAAQKQLDVEQVERSLEEALAAALRLSAPPSHQDLLHDVLLMRAELSLALGRAAAAGADLRLLARLDPGREELHPGLFSPTVGAAYAQARQHNAEAQSAFLAVSADAGGEPARVFVDGEPLLVGGILEGRDVGQGPHLVTIGAEGRLSRSLIVDLADGSTLVLEPHLPVPRAGKRREAVRARLKERGHDEEALAELAGLSGASAALLVGAGPPFAWSSAHGLVALEVAKDDPFLLARAAVRAAREPRLLPPPGAQAPEGPAPLALALGAGGAATVGVALLVSVGVLVWALQPQNPVDAPPRPVVVTGFRSEPR